MLKVQLVRRYINHDNDVDLKSVELSVGAPTNGATSGKEVGADDGDTEFSTLPGRVLSGALM